MPAQPALLFLSRCKVLYHHAGRLFCRIKGFNKFEAEFLEVFGQAKLTGELKVGLEQCLCLALLVDLEACLYVLQSTD